MNCHSRWTPLLRRTLELAEDGGSFGEVPVGALVVTADGLVVSEARNAQRAPHFDPTAHAEVLALRAAGAALSRHTLQGCTLVVSLEPCTMCAGAAVLSRVDRIVFAAWDPKAGSCGSIRDVTCTSLVAAPQGIKAMQEAIGDRADVHVVVAAEDEGLNEHNYIVPGLGDAGDRLYGIVD